MGTVGGDLCQRPRCWYYRQGFGLLAMKDGKSLVPTGANQYHAIFGGGPAYFVSASSLGPALIALGAKIKLVSAKGPREVPASAFLRRAAERDLARDRAASRRDPHRDRHSGRRREAPPLTKSGRRRRSIGLWPPRASCSTCAATSWRRPKSCSGTSRRSPGIPPEAAKAIAGKAITADTAEAAGKAAVAVPKPLSQNAYKVTLARVAVKRALLEAAKQKA